MAAGTTISYKTLVDTCRQRQQACEKPYNGRSGDALSDEEKTKVKECVSKVDPGHEADIATVLVGLELYRSVAQAENSASKRMTSDLKKYELSVDDLKLLDIDRNGKLEDNDLFKLVGRLIFKKFSSIILGSETTIGDFPSIAYVGLAEIVKDYLRSQNPELYEQAFPNDSPSFWQRVDEFFSMKGC